MIEENEIRRVISALRCDVPAVFTGRERTAYLTALLDVETKLLGGQKNG